jgi:hypothetical protein
MQEHDSRSNFFIPKLTDAEVEEFATLYKQEFRKKLKFDDDARHMAT